MIDVFSVVDLILGVFQNLMIVFFAYWFLDHKFSKSFNYLFIAVTILVMTGSNIIISTLQLNNSIFELLFFFAIMYLYTFIFLKSSVFLKIIFPIIEFLILMSITFAYSFMASAVFRVNPDYLRYSYSPLKILCTILIDFTMFMVMLFIYRVFKNKINNNNGEYVLVLFLPLVTIAVMFIIFVVSTYLNNNFSALILLSVLSFLMFFISIFVLYILDKINKSHQFKIENEMMKQKEIIYEQEIDNYNVHLKESQSIRHDIKNHILCIGTMIENGNYTEALKYCSEVQGEFENKDIIIATDNLYLNSIMNVVIKKARKNSVDIKINIENSLSSINEKDLVTLIGNLCDNAIDALANEDKKYMSVGIKKNNNFGYIIVKNSISHSVIKENPKLNTTKKDKFNHGHGVSIIKKTVEKYNGDVVFQEDNNMFIATAMLDLS